MQECSKGMHILLRSLCWWNSEHSTTAKSSEAVRKAPAAGITHAHRCHCTCRMLKQCPVHNQQVSPCWPSKGCLWPYSICISQCKLAKSLPTPNDALANPNFQGFCILKALYGNVQKRGYTSSTTWVCKRQACKHRDLVLQPLLCSCRLQCTQT